MLSPLKVMSRLNLFACVLFVLVLAGTLQANAHSYPEYDTWEPAQLIKDFKAAQKNHDMFIPDAKLNAQQLAKKYGYEWTTHEVTTEDEYILTIVRMKSKTHCPNRKPVILAHGLVDSSDTWQFDLPHQSLSYIMADACYDVFMTNDRGNTYSTKHKRFSNTDPRYWAFSWDESARYEIPAVVEFVLKETHAKSIRAYIGHSQGTSQGFALFSYYKPELVMKIDKFYALAPVMLTTHADIPFLRQIANAADTPMGTFALTKVLGKFLNPLLPRSSLDNKATEVLCGLPGAHGACVNVVAGVLGAVGGSHFNRTRVLMYMTKYPSGTSIQNIEHFAQSTEFKGQPGQFAQYDFLHSRVNQKKYGRPSPHKYNMTNLRIPTMLFSGGIDKLADPKDVSSLVKALEPCVNSKTCDIEHIYLPTYGHADFIWGTAAHKDIYSKIIEDLKHVKPAYERKNLAPVYGTSHGEGAYYIH
eukprot:Nk52_evm29s239 gene=Nk52_evmTU29s239